MELQSRYLTWVSDSPTTMGWSVLLLVWPQVVRISVNWKARVAKNINLKEEDEEDEDEDEEEEGGGGGGGEGEGEGEVEEEEEEEEEEGEGEGFKKN
ncbi:hypothetical protein HGM15179_014235 [Zosterops borbonicus]|uniref:Uncharacterized protein n=1 Tax=Zosterops borbonicus TaxID=364589 RepID=A0A8K1G6M0_9PASS|nr:hypothetical protein HGM15179_014235 [Zosterops borbonicus]